MEDGKIVQRESQKWDHGVHSYARCIDAWIELSQDIAPEKDWLCPFIRDPQDCRSILHVRTVLEYADTLHKSDRVHFTSVIVLMKWYTFSNTATAVRSAYLNSMIDFVS